MENAVEALKMAAAVLVFVMALGISISSFSQARQTSQTIIQYSDRETTTQYVEDTGVKTRTVGVDTIIPTLYRVFDENYRIVFETGGESGSDAERLNELYGVIENGTTVYRNYIDSEETDDNRIGIITGSDRDTDNFITALLYGNKNTTAYLLNHDGQPCTFSDYINELSTRGSRLVLNGEGIYDIIKGKTFEEKIGVYYPEDIESTNTGGSDIDVDVPTAESSILDVNKAKKRIITYTLQSTTPTTP